VGYAQLADTAALVVHPDARGAGHGSRLLAALLRAGTRPLSVWAHGDLPAAGALARAYGMRRSRELWQMRRPLDSTLPVATWPAGVTVRTYVPGEDDTIWLAVNADAFADHPEQGRMTQADLDARLSTEWFDPTASSSPNATAVRWGSTGPRCTVTRRLVRCTSWESSQGRKATGSAGR
jgi:mycothiol synthase